MRSQPEETFRPKNPVLADFYPIRATDNGPISPGNDGFDEMWKDTVDNLLDAGTSRNLINHESGGDGRTDSQGRSRKRAVPNGALETCQEANGTIGNPGTSQHLIIRPLRQEESEETTRFVLHQLYGDRYKHLLKKTLQHPTMLVIFNLTFAFMYSLAFGGNILASLFSTVLLIGLLMFCRFYVLYKRYRSMEISYNDLYGHFNRSERVGFFVAKINNQLIGTVAIDVLQTECTETADTAWMERLVVRKGFRRCGVARRLVHYAEAFCRSRNFARAKLYCALFRPGALALYADLGYEPYKVDELKYGIDILPRVLRVCMTVLYMCKEFGGPEESEKCSSAAENGQSLRG